MVGQASSQKWQCTSKYHTSDNNTTTKKKDGSSNGEIIKNESNASRQRKISSIWTFAKLNERSQTRQLNGRQNAPEISGIVKSCNQTVEIKITLIIVSSTPQQQISSI